MDNRGGKVVHSHQKCAKIKYFQAAADQYKYAGIEFLTTKYSGKYIIELTMQ